MLTFLLINGVIAGCDSCKTEKEKLEQEEKVLMEKIKKQVKPEYWEKIEKDLKESKEDKLKNNLALTATEVLIEELDKIIGGSPASMADKLTIKNFPDKLVGSSADEAKNITLVKQYGTNVLALLKNFKRQQELKK